MKQFFTFLLLASLGASPIYADSQTDRLTGILLSTVDRNTAVGTPKVSSVNINKAKKTITVTLNDAGSYLPFTNESIANLKERLLKEGFDGKLQDYKINIIADKLPVEKLSYDAKHKNFTPTEKHRFITHLDRFGEEPTEGLAGKNIAMWQSHGWYFEKKLNRWEWQRARLFQTVEDLYTQSYVLPFLMPMLENAGANAMTPRERDTSTFEAIVDNDGMLAKGSYSETGTWDNAGQGFAYKYSTYNSDPEKSNPFRHGSSRKAKAVKGNKATWKADIPEAGNYAVYASYKSLPGSTTDAIYTVHSAGAEHRVKVNQQMGGGTWIYLGHYDLPAGNDVTVLTLEGNDGKVITADAVKIGGGMGNIARGAAFENEDGENTLEEVVSGYPRFTEGARYFLQWAGMPDSIYSTSDGINDYRDDYTCRPHWVNYIAGGSSMLPKHKGLNIPVDLSFAFHSDAGTTPNDSIIGTLGIYSTDQRKPLPSGADRLNSRKLTDYVLTQIAGDVRSQFEPNWTRRGMWDKAYYEARAILVPGMLLELLSHQNFADMKYGLDPEFRFTVSRAIYKGILRYIAERDGRPYVVQPLAVKDMEITPAGGSVYKIQWNNTPDPLEPTADATYYIIEERVDNGGFKRIGVTDKPEFTFTANDSRIHSFRVIAGNNGGISFPSETLALCHKGNAPEFVIVNGFTRVSAPDTFDSGDVAGLYSHKDHGVPYVNDINFIGDQFEFRRDIPWSDDDAAGFGASRANYETKVIAGNTFDFVYTHGVALAEAGVGFVSSSASAYANSNSFSAPNVDIIFGKQKEIQTGTGAYGSRCKTFTAGLQERLREHSEKGGNIFISGSYIATDLWDNSFSNDSTLAADKKFAQEVLGYTWRVGQATTEGSVYEVPTPFKAFGRDRFEFNQTLNDSIYIVDSPDSFFASDNRGATLMRYSENNLVAATAMTDKEKGYKVVALGFPFETIGSEKDRKELMKQIVTYFKTPIKK